MAFGNVNVDYKPCKSVGQLKSADDYMLGKKWEQVQEGIQKTESHLYNALGCNRDNFSNCILVTRKAQGKSYSKLKENTILAHKISLSFHPDDNDKLTYKQAYQVAEEFAEEFFHSKGHETLFAVHTDTNHIHVHFLISNCHMETGKAFRRNQKDLYDMSEYFGNQCLSLGLSHSVREEFYNHDLGQKKDRLTFAEHQMRKRGKESFKDELRDVIQLEIADENNHTFDDVILGLEKHYNVTSRVAGNTVSYRHPEYKDKNNNPVSIRGSRLGELYTRKGIKYELEKKRDRQLQQQLREKTFHSTGITGEADTDQQQGFSRSTTDTAGFHTDDATTIAERLKRFVEQSKQDEGKRPPRSTGQISGYPASDNSRYVMQDFDRFYERYIQEHGEASQKPASTSPPSKNLRKHATDRSR